MWRSYAGFSLFVVWLFTKLAFGQEFTGNINGRVADATNAVLPSVTVTLSSTALQGMRSMVTDETGTYRFTLLPQGSYTVTYELPGFKKFVREGVIVEVGKTTTLNIAMEVASLGETVTVTGESPVVDVQNATVGVNFNTTTLRDIPNSRDIWIVLAQTPGTTVTRFDVGGSSMGTQGGYRSYGQNGQNWVTLDGINTTEGTSGAGFYMDYGAFAEIQVSAAANSAEVPIPGTAMTTVFKSGSNQLHGETFLDWETAKFQGDNVTQSLTNRGLPAGDKFSRYNDFNVQVGGPFKKDRFWWFGSFRDQFSGVTTAFTDNNGVPGQLFTTRLTNYTIKLNYQLNAKNSLAFSTQFGRKYQPWRGGQGVNAFRYDFDSTYTQLSWSQVGKVEWTRVINSRSTLDVSVNNFGYQFPGRSHVQKTPTFDQTTLLYRGGYSQGTSVPFLSQQRRWHANVNLSTYKDNFLGGNHDIKIGYMFLWHAPRETDYGAPGDPGSLGHVQLQYDNGTPAQFIVDNGPIIYENELKQNTIFFQDKFQIGRKLTLNFGVRYDRYHSYYPAGQFGLKGNHPCTTSTTDCNIGPFAFLAAQQQFPANDIATFNAIVPRFAFVYDIFGNTKTALKGSWGRYDTNTGTDISAAVNPINAFGSGVINWTYAWDGRPASQITPDYVKTLTPQAISAQAAPMAVDPALKDSYTDEFTAGIEHELLPNFGVHTTWVRKIQFNQWGIVNRAQDFAAWSPVQAIDPGPSGLLTAPDRNQITVFERNVPASALDYYLTNRHYGDNYNTIEFGATKRMSNNWQMIAGFDWTKRNLAPPFTVNPNYLLYGTTSSSNIPFGSLNAGGHTTGWTSKLIGSYYMPHGFLLSGGYNGQKGEPYTRTLNVSTAQLTAADPNRKTNLKQGNTTIVIDPLGSHYYETANIFNIRVQKNFKIRERNTIQAMWDLFNITNANTITSVNTSTGTTKDAQGNTVPQFGRVTQIIQPRIFKLGVRYLF
jgi:hypothetical protein